MRHVVSLVVVLCLAVGSISAATFVAPSDAELLGRARLVVVATVVDSVSREADSRMVYTDARLRIEDVIKGSIASDIVTVTEAGGFANGHGVAIAGSASYEPGTRVLAFLRQRDDGTYFTAYMALGKYRFVQRDGLELLVRDQDGVEVADESAFAARPAREFIESLRQGAPLPATKFAAQSTIASERGPATEAAATAYVFTGGAPVHPIRWAGCESGCTIDFLYNGDQAGVANEETSINNAMQIWNAEPYAFINLNLAGMTSALAPADENTNENSIILNYPTNGPIDPGVVCDGALGCGIIRFGLTHQFPAGTTWYSIEESDIVVFEGAPASLFEVIVAHELGHAMALRHSDQGSPSSNNALMRSSVPSGLSLRDWDREAVSTVYGNGLPCTPPSNLITSGAGTIFSGQTRTLSVSASGTAPLTYQWYHGSTGNSSNPVGTNSSQYTTPPLTETTSYWVKVSGCSPVQSANSSTITVTVDECPTPTITTQPQNQNIQSNHTATLTVAAQGGSPFTYQWYRGNTGNTSNPVGTNSTSFTTPQLTTNTNYWVRVTNTCGLVALSDTATVAIQECPKPAFTQQPASNTNVPLNTTVTLTVATTSATTVTYQWFRGAVGDTSNPVGTNSTSFTTPPVISAQTYWVRATNTCGPTNSEVANIAPGAGCAPLSILIIPSAVNVPLGQGATINVAPGGTGPFTYQWYQGESPDASAPIAGATNSALALEPFEVTGTFRYWIKVTDSCGTSINSTTVVVNVSCTTPTVPELAAPSISHFSAGYDVSWIANLVQTPSFELQEARDSAFTVGLKTFLVNGELHHHIDPHLDVTTDTRFYYRVRGISSCTQQPTPYSKSTSTVITAPQPSTSSEFSISVPQDATQTFTQPYLVPGFGETAHAGDTFAIVTDVPWLTVFPASGALSAGGTTVQFTINPSLLGIGSTTGSVVVTRTPGPAVKGGPATNATTGLNLPFTVSKVTPVTPSPRDANAPAGTLLVPAIAHADGIGTRFQSDVRIVNASGAPISYELSYTPSQTSGTETGKQLPLTIDANETKGLDDIVKAWFGSGLLGEAGLGTLEIRPVDGANALGTFASSRTYAIDATSVTDNADCKIVRCTLGQFIPALGLDKFISNIANDSQSRISLQQISNSLDATGFRTNLGFVEGSGIPATMRLTLFDGANHILNQVERSIPAYGHEQTSLAAVFGNIGIEDARMEVEVISAGGKVSSYASVVDNNTKDPLLVLPVQAQRIAAQHYVVPGVAELDNGPSSNFHTDMRIYNAGTTSITASLDYFPQTGDSTPRPASKIIELLPGQVKSLNNILPELWQLTRTGGAVAIDAPGTSSLVVTARTYSRDSDGGTYGQFIPGVTALDGVGSGERALEVLQLEQSDQYRTNLGLVEVTGHPVTVEVLGQTGAKITARTEFQLNGNEFRQVGRVFEQLGFSGASYTGRVSVRVIGGTGRVAAYGSVVDNKTVDPTYVPAQ